MGGRFVLSWSQPVGSEIVDFVRGARGQQSSVRVVGLAVRGMLVAVTIAVLIVGASGCVAGCVLRLQ